MAAVLTFLMCVLVAALYGTAGQAGGSGFVVVMTFAKWQPDEIRATAFALNIVAAIYASYRLHCLDRIDWRLLRPILVGSVPCAFIGGAVALSGPVYYALTGVVLLLVAALMMVRITPPETVHVAAGTAFVIGAITGLVSGATGVGGGVFLSSLLILIAGAEPKATAALSPPFILVNSSASLAAMVLSGVSVPAATIPLAGAALIGSAIGTAIGLRWMSARAIKTVLALILFGGGLQMLIHSVQG